MILDKIEQINVNQLRINFLTLNGIQHYKVISSLTIM